MKYISLFFVMLCSYTLVQATVVLEERKMKLKEFPCSSCHGDFVNEKAKFPLSKPHDSLKFKHMDSIKNCYTCHDKDDRDFLKLHAGEKISFDESYKLCFQCHGEKKRDWQAGIHGKQIGSWNGDKYKFVCTSCHEAHHPKFRMMKADPAPKHPRGKQSQDQGGH